MKWIKRAAGAMLLISSVNWVKVLAKHFLHPSEKTHWFLIVYDVLMIGSTLLGSVQLIKNSEQADDAKGRRESDQSTNPASRKDSD